MLNLPVDERLRLAARRSEASVRMLADASSPVTRSAAVTVSIFAV
jgi:hypothetical protein